MRAEEIVELIERGKAKDIELSKLRKEKQDRTWEIIIFNNQLHYIINRITCKEIHSYISVDKYWNYRKEIHYR